MKTPTKEEIKRILGVVPVEDREDVIRRVIYEWEKMKFISGCTNCPFIDFSNEGKVLAVYLDGKK